ncbi:hypothetical protein [Phormidium tenue]|uniref:Uncharacterized protein n=1 Tax=Phormidium tenue FACHB-1050 TaxID=2692857 RepID=A0ABR8C799_9CYAN|nr:hypothetical protein [Phormidium tenue]MBD2316653.1 hypothetical protein [Phormidium tenue FACHB-1050]
MSRPKKPVVIPISSQSDDDRYNKRSAARKYKQMGGSDLIQRKFYGDCEDDED